MEICLYDEEHGYYTSNKQKTGKAGDFYTSPGVHGVFSRVIARIITHSISSEELKPVVVDVGSGDGNFICSFLREVQTYNKELFNNLEYYVVESSPYHQKLIESKTRDFPMVNVFTSFNELLQEVPVLNGVLFSNELLDAFPVRVVEKRVGDLVEVNVGLDSTEKLIEVYKPCTDANVLNWIKNYGYSISEGQRIEVPLYMTSWVERVANWMEKGRMYTIDYGFTDEEWEHPARRSGSLRGYYKHQLVTDPLELPGEMDLTTHIPIDAYRRIGEKHNLKWVECELQGRFLTNNGLLDFVQEHKDSDPFSNAHKQNRAINWLAQMNQFQVIVQKK